jgi:preprotein translocase subunit SecE
LGVRVPPGLLSILQELDMLQKVTTYFSEVGQELSKVSWPTREELFGSTAVVIVLCLILAVFVFGVDWILNNVLRVMFQ